MKKRQPTQERQRQIADAALKIISEQGLRRFTTKAIAAEVGIADGTIFRHFPNKAAIINAALDRAEEILFDGFPIEHDNPVTRLSLFFQQRAQVASSHNNIIRLVQSEQLVHASKGSGSVRIAEWKKRSVEFIGACLMQARLAGLIRKDVPVEQLTIIIYGSLLGLVISGANSEESVKVEATQLWTTLESLLRPI